jgi:hypothetical protein
MLFIKSLLRFFLLCLIYPKPGLSYFFRIIGHFYGFRYRSKRDISAAIRFKHEGKLNNSNIGHATHNKTISLDIFSFNLFKFKIDEGENLTVEHFYLNRSIKDLQFLTKLSKPFMKVNKSWVVFDPACGTGKHLYYLIDKYNCKGIGVDIYQPAINVAKNANIGKSINFHCGSSLDETFISKILPLDIDLLFINSWLGYVKNEENFEKFIQKMLNMTRYIMIISSENDDLHSIFYNTDFIIEQKVGKAQFVLIRGFKETK